MGTWDTASELVVANTGEVSVAPVGTALPDDPTEALNAAFVGLGFCNEDGATFTVTPNVAEFAAWQARRAIRRELTMQDIQVQFNLQQWNENNIPLAFGGGEITNPSNGVYRYDFPLDGDALDERAMVVDAVDGDKHFRIVLPRGNVTDAVATNFKRSSEALLPITFKLLEDGPYIVTDDGAFALGS